jgi:alanine racemase
MCREPSGCGTQCRHPPAALWGLAGRKEMQIAILPIGYADGFSRRLGNGNGEVKINGKNYSVIGNVCMDMIMVDITGGKIKEGDLVIIFDDQNSLLSLAKSMETIPYEVLTSVSSRVKRVYFRE